MEKVLAMYDQDQNYMRRLAHYVQNRKRLPFSVYAFTDLEELKCFARQKKIGMLLTAEQEKTKLITAGDVICLSDSQDAEGEKIIYKYQSGDAIVRELMRYYGDTDTGRADFSYGKQSDVLVVFSPVGRCGKSLLALTLASILGREKKVLYLCLEESSWLNSVIENPSGGTLTEALYYFKEDMLDSMKLRAMIYQMDHMDYIAPVRNPSDLAAVTSSELEHFLSALRRMGGYEIIVADLDGQFSRFSSLAPQSKWIFVPSAQEETDQEKLRQFELYAKRNAGEQIMKHMFRVRPPMVSAAEMQQDPQTVVNGILGEYASRLIRDYVYGEE